MIEEIKKERQGIKIWMMNNALVWKSKEKKKEVGREKEKDATIL